MALYEHIRDTCSSILEELQEMRDLLLEVKEVKALIKEICDKDRERELRVASLDEELKLRKKKRKQLICSGIKESSAATSVDRYEDDKNAFKNLMTVMKCNIQDDDINFISRIRDGTVKGNRLLCIGFINEVTRDHVLDCAHNLKGSGMDGCRVQPDITKWLRKIFRDQLETAKKKNFTREGLKLSEEFRVVGQRGNTRLIKVPSVTK